MRPGYCTTEFWLHVATVLVTVGTLVFHRNFTGAQADIPVATSIAAFLGSMVYTVSRTKRKGEFFKYFTTELGNEVKQLIAMDVADKLAKSGIEPAKAAAPRSPRPHQAKP